MPQDLHETLANHRPNGAGPTFAQALEHLYERRYTGVVILHCHNGVPKIIEVPQPGMQIQLASPRGA